MAITREKLEVEATAEVKRNDLKGLISSIDHVEASSEKFKATIKELEARAEKYIQALEQQGIDLESLEDRVQAASKANDELAKSSISASNSLENLSKSTQTVTKDNENLTSTLGAVAGGYRSLVDSVNNTVQVIETLTNPETLKRLAIFLRFLSNILRFKGFDGLAAKARESADGLDELRQKLDLSEGAFSLDNLAF